MLNVVSGMIEEQQGPRMRMSSEELLAGVQMPQVVRELLQSNMEMYRLDSAERMVIARLLLGDSTTELCYALGLTSRQYHRVLERIGRKTNGGVGKAYGDRTKIVLTLLGIGPRQ